MNSLNQVQLYVRVKDTIATEGPILPRESFDRFSNAEEAFKNTAMETRCPNNNAAEYYPQFLNDIRLNGVINNAVNMHPNGIIGDGNFRRIWHIWAGMEFMPINLDYLLCDSSKEWMLKHPYLGRGAAGKTPTIHQVERWLEPPFNNWWENEARNFLVPRIRRWGTPPKEFNLSYKECLARLKQ